MLLESCFSEVQNHMQKVIIQNGLVNEKLEHLFKKPVQSNNLSSIKWGMIMIGIGFGFLAKQFWPNQFYDEGFTGIILLLGGFGFISYYFIAKKIEGK